MKSDDQHFQCGWPPLSAFEPVAIGASSKKRSDAPLELTVTSAGETYFIDKLMLRTDSRAADPTHSGQDQEKICVTNFDRLAHPPRFQGGERRVQCGTTPGMRGFAPGKQSSPTTQRLLHRHPVHDVFDFHV